MHRAACTISDIISSQATHTIPEAVYHVRLQPTVVLLGNQATKAVFKDACLRENIHQAKYSIAFEGVGGISVAKHEGACREFRTVAYLPTGIANILSFADVEVHYPIRYNREKVSLSL
jgi:hypothetical protein